MTSIRRVLILGHSGFVGANLERSLRANAGLEVVGLSLGDVDLTAPRDAASLARYFEPDTAVVMCSAIKRQAGDTRENYLKNVSMAANLSAVLEARPVGRFLYFSSTAVYGEDVHNEAITEKTSVCPTSYYGMAKYAAERLLLKAAENRTPSPLVVLRPPTIYGADEPGRPYGPMGFLRAALAHDPVTLWGDGSEKREFLFVDDACAAVRLLLDHPFTGVLNLVSGKSVTFKDIIAEISLVGPSLKTASRARTKAMADHSFDNSLLRSLFPELRLTPLREGLKTVRESKLASVSR